MATEPNKAFAVERPFSDTTMEKHLKATLNDLGSVTRGAVMRAEKILDVGVGTLRRSALALRRVFPNATVHAIDNDIRLVNEIAEQRSTTGEKLKFLFGDAELWLPKGQYDLIVVSLVTHTFYDPERAIANLVATNLKTGGYLLFVHRTDAIMRATARTECDAEQNDQVKAIQSVWTQIHSAWQQNTKTQLELPWRTRCVCRHDEMATCCGRLALVHEGTSTKKYDREKKEKLSSLFGSAESQPQYQAPRIAWQMFDSRRFKDKWPKLQDAEIKMEIELSSFIYRKTELANAKAAFHFPHKAAPQRFVQLAIRPDQEPDAKEFVDAVLDEMPALKEDVLDFYYITGDQITSLRKVLDPSLNMPGGLQPNLLTKALQASKTIWDHHRGNHEFLCFIFPALLSGSSLANDYVQPASAADVFGWKAQDTYMIPLLDDTAGIETYLERGKFAELEIPATAQYLKARGGFARRSGCVAIYYVIFRSRLLDDTGNFQAVSFLAKNWLPIEAIRSLAHVAYAFLLAMEEQRVLKLLISAKERDHQTRLAQKRLEDEINRLTSTINSSMSLAGVLDLIQKVEIGRHDAALRGVNTKLEKGLTTLKARILLAALESEPNRAEAVRLLDGAQSSGVNDSSDGTRLLLRMGHAKAAANASCLKEALQNIITDAGKNPALPEYQQLIQKVLG